MEEAARARRSTSLRLETGSAGHDPLYGVYVGSDLSLCYERAL